MFTQRSALMREIRNRSNSSGSSSGSVSSYGSVSSGRSGYSSNSGRSGYSSNSGRSGYSGNTRPRSGAIVSGSSNGRRQAFQVTTNKYYNMKNQITKLESNLNKNSKELNRIQREILQMKNQASRNINNRYKNTLSGLTRSVSTKHASLKFLKSQAAAHLSSKNYKNMRRAEKEEQIRMGIRKPGMMNRARSWFGRK